MGKQYTHKHPKLNLRTEKDLLRFLNAAKTVKTKNKTLKKQVTSKDLHFLSENAHLEWSDHPTESNPIKKKYVRFVKPGSSLNITNRRLNAALKLTLDKKVPGIFYGSVSKKSHIQAAEVLCNGKNTTIISLDITRFFESISPSRVARFFGKAGCSPEIIKVLVDITCVPLGSKNEPLSDYSLARGFPTSPRLALWATYEIFVKLNRVLLKNFPHLSPKMVIFVDDVGISIKNATIIDVEAIKETAFSIIENDKNGINLEVHKKPPKLKVRHISQTAEHLGLVIGKKSLAPGFKTRVKIGDVKTKLSDKSLSKTERETALQHKRGLMNYKRSVRP
ncbi:MAG: hypothetical protein KBB78_02270 [Candidatus Pacebacteria bacterium]|nr:hypothetical protein [Candidatus Paceibacterota bacterium]